VLRPAVKNKAALFVVEAKFGCDDNSATTVRDILNTEEVHIPEATSGACGMAIGKTTVELINACSRMMDLLDTPRDTSFFRKLIQREIVYRLLQGSLGARLRAIATFETKCHRTSKAVVWLRSNYEKPLQVEGLATIAGMSRSTLHPPFSRPYGNESAAISKAASPACRAATHAHE
jgi:hypothetical protein